MAITLATATQNAACNAMVDLIDGGVGDGLIRIYTATRPASANTAISGQTLLAEFTCNDPAFGAASSGVATFDVTGGITATGLAAGTAAWARVVDSAEATVFDGSVGTSGTDFIINTTTISVGLDLSITSGTYTMPSGE